MESINIIKKIKMLGAIIGVIAFIGGLFLSLPSFKHNNHKSATFVEDITANKISVDDVIAVEFIRERPGFAVEPEVHSITSRDEIIKLMSDLKAALKVNIYRGHRHHNHPSTLIPEQRVEILIKDGSKYEFYGNFHRNWDGGDYYYFTFNTWPRLKPDDNWGGLGSTSYESRELVKFMLKYSPFIPEELR